MENAKSGKRENYRQSKSAASIVSVPQINLPKDGGAVRDIGNTFAANSVTRSGLMSIFIATRGHSGYLRQVNQKTFHKNSLPLVEFENTVSVVQEEGPDIVFADYMQPVYLDKISGNGTADRFGHRTSRVISSGVKCGVAWIAAEKNTPIGRISLLCGHGRMED